MRQLAALGGIGLIALSLQAAPALAAESIPASPLPDGIYAVLRVAQAEDAVRPLAAGEIVLRSRPDEKVLSPPPFVVVNPKGHVPLELAAEPKREKSGPDSVRIHLQLGPRAAAAFERLTRDCLGRSVAVVLGGEVVSVHKVRAVIAGGEVEVTTCPPAAAERLLERLQNRPHGR